jgi:hypothetical protein
VTNFALGKAPARKNSILLWLDNYIHFGDLPVAPREFGQQALVTDWGMLGNDNYGDCVWAGAAHETMLWNAEAGSKVTFADDAVLSDYSAVTGFDPSDPSTDQGTDMQKAAAYRQKTGVLDAFGHRHTVEAYVALKKRSLDWITRAAYAFGAVGVGIRFPSTAMAQFNAGKPWSYVPFSTVEGGHYVPIVGRLANGNLLCVTWGQIQEMTPTFFWKYNDENVAYLSLEALKNSENLLGLNVRQLEADLRALRR